MSELNYCQFCNCKTVTDTCKTCQQAVDAERERIIGLLDKELKDVRSARETALTLDPVDIRILWEVELKIATWKRGIALIKGEK